MKILLTGSSGFLGKILAQSLQKKHEVIGLGRDSSCQISCDLAKEIPNLPQCDLIIHAAGKAHQVPKNEQEAAVFFEVNQGGTQHLLEGIKILPKSFILISSVSVYGVEDGELITEDHPIKGESPYAKSKRAAEELVLDWGEKNQVPVLVLRLPLVVGPNPPGNLGAMIKAIRKGYYRRIGEGKAKKSMVMAEDLAQAIPDWVGKPGIYHLTDGVHPSMAELDVYLSNQMNRSVKRISPGLLKILAKIGDRLSFFPLNSYRLEKLEHSLTFSDQKARKELGWNPRSVVGNFETSS